MKGLLVKDMEFMKGNTKTFAVVYLIAMVCFLGTNAGPSFLISYVSVLAAIMAVNLISGDMMNNGLAYIFTFPVSRREYVKEKYLFGAGLIVVLWLLAVVLACVVNVAGFRAVSGEEVLLSSVTGLLLALLAEAVMFPVQLKYGNETGRIVLFVVVFGTMGLVWVGQEVCERMHVDFSLFQDFGRKFLNLGIPLIVGLLLLLLLLLLLFSCTISIKIMEKKEY